jgi:23S rRNA (guanine2445-N2)-methyltransferase / 23S rRNA (guanine2069-N7)-methyltransferase
MHVLATAALGTVDLVEQECRKLGLDVLGNDRDGVHMDLGWPGIATALVHLRLATRLLLRLGDFAAHNAESLYEGTRRLPWLDWLDPNATFAIFASGDLVPTQNGRQGLEHHVFVSQKVKDALCDVLRSRYGRRPNVNADDPDVRISVRGRRGRWSVWLDLSGPPLHERGLRMRQLTAPLKETLAATVATLAGWQPGMALRDPFCGSGTLTIETVNLGLGIAPGCTRWFGVERWPLHGQAAQKELDQVRGAAVAHAQGVLQRTTGLDIEASDTDSRAMQAIRENLRAAGLDGVVRVVQRDARVLPPVTHGVIVGNPPYGMRLDDANILEMYQQIGAGWKACQDTTVAILCGNVDFVTNFGWPVESARELRNGPIEVGLFRYKV